jgi:broad specificity phosphatase PhoE
MTVRLLLIRHGRVDFTSRDFTQSPRGRQWDPPLDEAGLEQAKRLSARLVLMEPPAKVLVSPFTRCRQTIEPYLEVTGAQPTMVDDLGEVFVGEWEGMRFEDIVSGDEELARRFRESEPMFGLAPGGESGPQLRARVVPAVEEQIADVSDGAILAVTHGGVINAFLGDAMSIPHDMFFLPDNASINTVHREAGRYDVRFLNDVRHVTDPAIFAPPAGAEEGVVVSEADADGNGP